jgi:hypothetical protein
MPHNAGQRQGARKYTVARLHKVSPGLTV